MNTSVQQLPVLRADSLQVGHDGRVVLRCDDLQLFRGEMIALMGASGTGKTTFFSVLAGHAEPLSGRIVTPNGVVHRDWLRKKVARTLQNFPLLHWLTVAQSIRLAAYLRGVSCPDPRMILDQVSAEDLELRLPHTLSGGERCRVS